MRCVLRLLAHPRFRPFRRFQLRLAGLRAAGGDLHCMGKPVADLTFVLDFSNHFQVKHALLIINNKYTHINRREIIYSQAMERDDEYIFI